MGHGRRRARRATSPLSFVAMFALVHLSLGRALEARYLARVRRLVVAQVARVHTARSYEPSSSRCRVWRRCTWRSTEDKEKLPSAHRPACTVEGQRARDRHSCDNSVDTCPRCHQLGKSFRHVRDCIDRRLVALISPLPPPPPPSPQTCRAWAASARPLRATMTSPTRRTPEETRAAGRTRT